MRRGTLIERVRGNMLRPRAADDFATIARMASYWQTSRFAILVQIHEPRHPAAIASKRPRLGGLACDKTPFPPQWFFKQGSAGA